MKEYTPVDVKQAIEEVLDVSPEEQARVDALVAGLFTSQDGQEVKTISEEMVQATLTAVLKHLYQKAELGTITAAEVGHVIKLAKDNAIGVPVEHTEHLEAMSDRLKNVQERSAKQNAGIVSLGDYRDG